MVTKRKKAILRRVEEVSDTLLDSIDADARLVVVQAPPGSGKTFLLLEAADFAVRQDKMVAVATQTNSQADDICRRMAREHPKVPTVRFAGSGSDRGDLDPSVGFVRKAADLPSAPCVVVGTSAKWGSFDPICTFDLLLVEEAWQLSWADFMLLSHIAGRFVLIGDPGQVPPVVTIDPSRWETSPRAPHRPAPEVILQDPPSDLISLSLPATWRLPYDSVDLVRPFYDFPFAPIAAPGEQKLLTKRLGRKRLQRALSNLYTGSVLALTLPTPAGGPPLELDQEIADLAGDVVMTLAQGSVRYRMNGKTEPLEPSDIGLCATHRLMVSTLNLALPDSLAGEVCVDTPERWQGLERKVMVVAHPLSGVTRPSAFDLETGRLCVMASRHQVALVVVTRDHVGDTLAGYFPTAEQAVGRPDVTGQGHARHFAFWSSLEEQGRAIAVGNLSAS